MPTSMFLGLRTTRRLSRLGAIAGLAVVGACSDSTAVSTSPAVTHIRIVNALLQSSSEGPAVTRPIDYLFDSLVTAPSVMNIAANGLSAGDSANGYFLVGRGLHSYIARLAGDTTAQGMLYTNSASKPYLPKQRLIESMYYTLVVTGILPEFGSIPQGAVPFTILVDDPFPPPQFNGAYQARFRVINAAPYANPADADFAQVLVYVTPGSTPPSDPSIYQPLDYAAYPGSTGYLNVDAGTYVLTLVSGTTGATVAQQSVTFASGEVRTFILRSTSDGDPSTANHMLTNILDHQYGP